jgi:ABC-type Fe3+-hydroxamate transport system substrate-binding protein
MNEEENRIEDANRLREAGLFCHASFPRSVAETAAMVRSIAGALERPAEGESIARDIEERAARVAEAAQGKARISWAYLIWRKPWMAVNRDTFAHALLELAGGTNVFAGRAERYPVIETAELAHARPDVVLLGSEPFAFQERHVLELSQEAGIPRARFRIADGELLSWHGSRTPAGIDYAENLLDTVRRA